MKIQAVIEDVKEKIGQKGKYWIIVTQNKGDFFTNDSGWLNKVGEAVILDYEEPNEGFTARWLNETRQYPPRQYYPKLRKPFTPKGNDEILGVITSLEVKIDTIEKVVKRLLEIATESNKPPEEKLPF